MNLQTAQFSPTGITDWVMYSEGHTGYYCLHTISERNLRHISDSPIIKYLKRR